MKKIDPGLQFFGDAVEAGMRLDDLALFLDEVDMFLSTAAECLIGSTAPESKSMSHQFNEPLPDILFSSFVISVVSFIERQALHYARVVHQAAGTPLAMTDLAGTWYERFRKYVEHLAKLDIGFTNLDWSNLKDIVEVRNCLAHAGGDLSNFQRKSVVEQFLQRNQLSEPQNGFVPADRRLAEKSIEIGRAFIKSIYDSAIARYPAAYQDARHANLTAPH